MKLRVHAATDVGLVRERNEDSHLVDSARSFFAVADGLGGMPGGDVASATAVALLREVLARSEPGEPCDLAGWVQRAHEAVGQAGRRFGDSGIATTLTCAHLAEGQARIAHVGDSFALLVRDDTCRALTREHNMENERQDPMALAPYPSRYRYALTRVVGGPEPVLPEIFQEQLAAGDRLVLATDGLTDLLDWSDVARICREHPDPRPCVEELVAVALQRRGHDNITVIVINVDEI